MNGFTEWLKDKLIDLKDDLVKAHKSLTIHFNLWCASLPEAVAYLAMEFPKLESYVIPEQYRRIMQALLIANMVLRFRTNKALSEK